MIDANQRWDVGEAIERVRALAEFRPLWIEEPTSPDDVLGHAAIASAIRPIGVATGEHCANRVLFKQLMQAGAISFCQIDSCRLGGVNENLAVILMAAKFGVPVCPHAGGVGLCEMVQHLSMFDYIAVSASLENRVTEFVDHLHEHFVDPVVIRNARYMPPVRPGTGRRSCLRHAWRTGILRDLCGLPARPRFKMSVFTNSSSSSPEEVRQYVGAVLGLLGDRNALDVLKEMPAALASKLDGLSALQIVQAEAAGKWAVRDVFNHLADSELVWGYRLRMVLAQERPTLTGYDQDLWAERLHYEHVDVKMALDRFTVLRRSNLTLLDRASDADLNRVGLHAERGEESLRHMIRLYAGHDLLHLRQLDRIREAVG